MKRFPRILSTPVLLLLVCLLAYGIQSLRLGFYLDDWVGLYHIYRGGFARLAAYFFGVNRPAGVWTWWLGYSLLGYSPLGWQFWSIFWRWLAGLFFWLALRGIWPEKDLQISLAAALFVVYPIFLEQSNALTFSHHWICYALLALSLALMVYSLKSREARKASFYPLRSVLLTGAALLASALQLVTIEYFAGIELVRPLLIWFHFRCARGRKARLKQTALHEAPYALVFSAFAVWRLLLMPTPGADRNTPRALYGLVHSPLATLPEFITRAFQDLVEAIAATWYKTYQPNTITLSPPANLLSWGIVLLAFGLALGFCFFAEKRYRDANSRPGGTPAADGELLALGLAMLLAGFLPAWAIGEHLVSSGNYSDRFGLAAMFGASLLLVSAASLFLRRNTLIVLACLLVGLGTGYQFRLENNFRWSWERQARLSWQLRWRMPGIAAQTVLYGDGVFTGGSWVDIAWINFLYSRPSDAPDEDYWYSDLSKLADNGVLQAGQPITEKRFERLSYRGNTSDSIVIQFKGVENQCAWVVDPQGAGFGSEEAVSPYLDPKVKNALRLSNLNRVLSTTDTNLHLPEMYPPEPAQDWCYYFERASLAVQQKQWQVVRDLWQQAALAHLQTGVAAEYLPFIYGIAQSGDTAAAIDISRRVKTLDVRARESICQTWNAVLKSAPGDAAKIKQEIGEEYQCGWGK